MASKLPLSFEEGALPRPLAPDSASGWYRIFTPVKDFAGVRLGKSFEDGEAVVGAHETRSIPMPGQRNIVRRLVDIFVQDFGYEAIPIAPGVPPVHSRSLPPDGALVGQEG